MANTSREISMSSVSIPDSGAVRGVWSDVPPAPTVDLAVDETDEMSPLHSAELEVLEVLGMSRPVKGPPPPPAKSARVKKRPPSESVDPDAGESWMHQGVLSAPPIPREALDLDDLIETLSEHPPAPPIDDRDVLSSIAISSLPPLPGPVVMPLRPVVAPLPAAETGRRAPFLAGAVGFALGIAATLTVGFALQPNVEVTSTPVAAPAAVIAEPAVAEPTLAEPTLAEPGVAEPTVAESADSELVGPSAVEAAVHLDVEPGTVATFERPARPAARPTAQPIARATAQTTARPIAGAPAQPIVQPRPSDVAAPVAERAPARTGLPAQPSREAVEAAIASVSERMRECAPEYAHQVAQVRFSFASSGRVTSALVPADFAGPQQRSCVARAARAAHVPPFSAERLDVTYPVQF